VSAIGRTVLRGAAVLLAVMLWSASYASAQKIGYIASEAIFDRLPQAIEARAKLSDLQGKWAQEIKQMEETVTSLRTEIDRNRLLWSAQERTQKESELRDAEGKLADYRGKKFGPNGEFETQYRELMSPIIELVSVAVNAEAEKQEYDFVFDKSSRGLPMLFANPDFDLTYDVLKRLGVEVDPSEMEARKDKKFQLLPESLPINIGDKLNIGVDASMDAKVRPPSVKAELPQSEKVEANPNQLLSPKEETEDPK